MPSDESLDKNHLSKRGLFRIFSMDCPTLTNRAPRTLQSMATYHILGHDNAGATAHVAKVG
jgi:hypothetical protein